MEFCNESSVFFKVVSSTGWLEVGKTAMEFWNPDPSGIDSKEWLTSGSVSVSDLFCALDTRRVSETELVCGHLPRLSATPPVVHFLYLYYFHYDQIFF